MKVVSNRVITVQESNDVLGIKAITLAVSVVKLSDEAAQVIVVDPRSQVFTNMVCVMNLPQGGEATSSTQNNSTMTTSVLIDQALEEAKGDQEIA